MMNSEISPVVGNEQKLGKYGLPVDVQYCKKCVQTNQRPSSAVEFKNKPGAKKLTLNFDEEGICDACRYAEAKKNIDWEKRDKELWEMLSRFRSKDGSYDVVVPGSGGKDSVMASYLLRYKYDMHPLLVTWPPHIYTTSGWKNFLAWSNEGFDNISYMPNRKVHRMLTKFAFEKLCHPFQPFIIGQKNLAPKVSVKYNIPLVMFGENEAEYGNPLGDNEKPTRDNSFYAADHNFDEIYLGGVCVQELMEKYGMSRADLEPYLPTDPEHIEKVGTEVHYLGYYVKWDPQETYYFSVENTDFMPNSERTEGSYSKYASFDDKIDWLHYFTYFVKFGIGRATDDAAHEIRNGHLTRDEGVRLVKRFDGEFPKKYLKENLEYMGITEERFHEVVDEARPEHLWEKKNGQWIIKRQVDFI